MLEEFRKRSFERFAIFEHARKTGRRTYVIFQAVRGAVAPADEVDPADMDVHELPRDLTVVQNALVAVDIA